ncbi:erythromycin esterase family protein [Spirosoma taeanense]|uniref:Erythromycin esterase family protein n=1 Tax=Spirosoma taeanense TaxID=2735870 RepID=A0A6M5YDR9_9BACT|nr:erythromycin esterase family protein [Spirosoma taeanense]QJW91441.1 erythromycin esterase family protein [Spirosoma taeanense]
MTDQPQTQSQSFRLRSEADLDPLLERIGEARYVLLGEASHGTHEYYTWRARISKRLIEERGFSFIAVEGDWPDCYAINRFVKAYPGAGTDVMAVLQGFERWPTWMWANYEIAALANWLRRHNEHQPDGRKVGFYGLDVYSLWESVEVLNEVLKQQQDPQTARLVDEVVQCFQPYGEDERRYAQAVAQLSESCRREVTALLSEIRRKASSYDHEPEAALNAEMNAWVAVNAERYYESMYSYEENSWNIRDTHMVETLNRLMTHHGPDAKCIVWEHNTHIGDARYTDMAQEGMVNVGQLVRQQQAPDDVVLVGFGSYQGSVIAGRHWGASMESMTVPPARSGSVEALLHREQATDRLLIFDGQPDERFSKERGHRAIGVVYRPEREQYGNYVPTVLARRYDAFLYLDQTRALHPLDLHTNAGLMPEGYPFGV